MVFCLWQFKRVSPSTCFLLSPFNEHTESPNREALNRGITKLQANGVIDSIREKWIRYSDRNCGKVNSLFLNYQLNIDHFCSGG